MRCASLRRAVLLRPVRRADGIYAVQIIFVRGPRGRFQPGVVICAPLLTPWLGISQPAGGHRGGQPGSYVCSCLACVPSACVRHLAWGHPAMRQILRLYLPVSVSLLVGQFQVMVDANLTSRTHTERGLDAVRHDAVQFPLGLVPVAVSLAACAHSVASCGRRRASCAPVAPGRGLRLVFVLLIPAIAALFVMAVQPITAGRSSMALCCRSARGCPPHGAASPSARPWPSPGSIFSFSLTRSTPARTRHPAGHRRRRLGCGSPGCGVSLLQPLGFLGLVLADSTNT